MYGSSFISGFDRQKKKQYLFTVVFLVIFVAWLAYLMWSSGIGKHVVLMKDIPEWTTYLTVGSISGLFFAGLAVYFRPAGESASYVLKLFGGGFSIGFVTVLNCYDVYVYVTANKITQYESEYEVTFPGPSKGKYSHCEAGLWIKDAPTKSWIRLCTNRTDLYNERKQGMTKVWVMARSNQVGSYIINYHFIYD